MECKRTFLRKSFTFDEEEKELAAENKIHDMCLSAESPYFCTASLVLDAFLTGLGLENRRRTKYNISDLVMNIVSYSS